MKAQKASSSWLKLTYLRDMAVWLADGLNIAARFPAQSMALFASLLTPPTG